MDGLGVWEVSLGGTWLVGVAWHLATVQHVDQEVEEGDYVIAAARCVKFHLVGAGEHEVSFEYVEAALLCVVACMLVQVTG